MFTKSRYISLKNFCFGERGVCESDVKKVFVFRVKISSLIVMKIGSKVLHYAKLEGYEHRLGRLTVTKAVEKPVSRIVCSLEFESHFHMALQILSMTVILPGNHKCCDHSHCGTQKIKGRHFFLPLVTRRRR